MNDLVKLVNKQLLDPDVLISQLTCNCNGLIMINLILNSKDQQKKFTI